MKLIVLTDILFYCWLVSDLYLRAVKDVHKGTSYSRFRYILHHSSARGWTGEKKKFQHEV